MLVEFNKISVKVAEYIWIELLTKYFGQILQDNKKSSGIHMNRVIPVKVAEYIWIELLTKYFVLSSRILMKISLSFFWGGDDYDQV